MKKQPSVVLPPAPPSFQIIDPRLKAGIAETHRVLMARVNALFLRYGATKDNLEIRHLEALDRVLDAASVAEAEDLAKRAEDKVFMTLLALTAKGKIVAKTPEAYRKRADKAESLASYFWNQYIDFKPETEKDNEKRYRLLQRHTRQTERASNMREYARRLEQNPNIASFEELYGAKDEDPTEDDVPVVDRPDKPVRTPRARKNKEGESAVRSPVPSARVSRRKAQTAVRGVRRRLAAKKR